jgi:hypothetical protein
MLAAAADLSAEALEDFTYRAGSDLGRAIFCQEPTAEAFAAMALARIQQTASDPRQWGAAMVLFADAARIRAVYGPISESCSDFLEGYGDAFRALQTRTYVGGHRRERE